MAKQLSLTLIIALITSTATVSIAQDDVQRPIFNEGDTWQLSLHRRGGKSRQPTPSMESFR
jgi:hypothetical protein